MATRLENQLIEWHERNYGRDVDVAATYRHLLEEVGELGEALINGDSRESFNEAGDVAILLFHVLRGAYPGASLASAMACAHDKCLERERLRQPEAN